MTVTAIENIKAEVGSGGYKWEDSPGLYHSCGVCGTALNSVKAKKTCYGTHSEPCIRYHQTMFQIGESHKCEACRNSNEQRDKRHREIAGMVQKVHLIDGEQPNHEIPQEPQSPAVGVTKKASLVWSPNPAATSQEKQLLAQGLTKKASLVRVASRIIDWNDGCADGWKKSCQTKLQEPGSPANGIPRKASLVRAATRVVDRNDGCSDAGSCNGSIRQKPSAMLKRDERELKKAVKLARETDKAQQRQEQGTLPGVFSQSTLEKIDVAIHGHSTNPASAASGDFCDMLLDSIRLHQQLEAQLRKPQLRRQRTGAAGSKDDQAVSILQLEHIRRVFNALGVQPIKGDSTRDRKELVGKLASAIWLDIELVANEARETLRRFAGYWNWANKRTYNAMVANHQIVEWSTGERVPEVKVSY